MNLRLMHAAGTLLTGLALLAGVIVGYIALTSIQPRTLTVTGTASQTLASDKSLITGTWQEKAADSAAARSAVEKRATAALTALKELKIEDGNLKTIAVNVYPEYDYSTTRREPKITGYTASTTLQVTLTDLTLADSVLKLLTEKGADSLTGPQFTLTTEAREALQKELRVAAIADARTQAAAQVQEAGGRLGKVLSIVDKSSVSPDQPIPYLMDSAVDAAEKSSDLTPGESELSVSVSVTYQLR